MIGKTISHYKIIEQLGAGGMGVVYKARDLKLDRDVALKFLPPNVGQEEDERQRFIHEAKAASALDHNNIGTVYDIDHTEDGQLFIAMAYYPGQSLRNMISTVQGDEDSQPVSFDIEHIISIVTQIALGLAKAHEKGIVHRDIKPANIMVTNDGVVKIVDFGLAKLSGQTKMTKTGTTVGTVAYMSPEQTRSETIDQRTDIWSLGVVLYQMLTGKLPFRGEYDQAVVYSILNADPEYPDDVVQAIPEELIRIINRALCKDLSQRYQQVEDLLADLKTLSGESDSTTQIKRKTPAKRGIFSVAGALLGVIIIVVGYLLFTPEAESRERVPIVVVDFVNETNERELNALSGVLITSLEQSRRLAVFTRSSMFDVLKKLGKSNVDRIDESLGREICKQAGIKTMAQASIRKFGRLYSIDLKVLHTDHDEYLFTVKEDGEGQESIPGMIDNLAEKTREGLAEAKSDIAITQKSVETLATSNLQAYYHYFKGSELIDKLKFGLAEKEFEQAIKLDSMFALAYYSLAYAKWWLPGQEESYRIDLLEKALSFPERLPEKEKLLALAQIRSSEQGFSAGFDMLRPVEKLYINDKEFLFHIGDYAFHAGLENFAGQYFDRVIEKDPYFIRALDHRIQLYENQGARYKAEALYMKVFPETLSSELFYAKGYTAFALGKYKEAEELFTRSMYIDSADFDAHFFLGKTLLNQRKYVAAESVFVKLRERGSDIYSDISDRYVTWCLFHQGRYSEAESRFKAQIKSYPDLVSPYLGVELALEAQKKHKKASDFAAKHKNFYAQKVKNLQNVAWVFFNSRDFELADQVFRKVIEFDPDNKEALNGLGWSLNNQRNFKNAQLFFEKACAIDSTYIIPLRGLGWTLYHQENYAEAELKFKKAVQLDNESELSMRGWSRSLFRQRKNEEAETVLRRSIQLYPDYAWNYLFLHWTLYFQRKYQPAKEVFFKFLKMKPDYKFKDEMWGHYYLALEEFEKAESYYLDAYASDSTSQSLNEGLAILYGKLNQFNRAKTYATRALTAGIADDKNFTTLAWILFAGYIDLNKAVSYARTTIDSCNKHSERIFWANIDPYVPMAEHTLGRALMKKGDYKQALVYLEKAVELVPDRTEIKKDLALAREKVVN